MKFYTTLETLELGELLLVANDTHLVGLYFMGCGDGEIEKDWELEPKHPVLRQATEEIEEYLKGKRKTFSAPLHFEGTKFQNAVWREIARVPFGETISYSELAARAGNAAAIRAAGTATGSNPLSIIIPCHRILGKHGAFGGYGGGLHRKRHLLTLEGREDLFPQSK